jgi:hypothetical protein
VWARAFTGAAGGPMHFMLDQPSAHNSMREYAPQVKTLDKEWLGIDGPSRLYSRCAAVQLQGPWTDGAPLCLGLQR